MSCWSWRIPERALVIWAFRKMCSAQWQFLFLVLFWWIWAFERETAGRIHSGWTWFQASSFLVSWFDQNGMATTGIGIVHEIWHGCNGNMRSGNSIKNFLYLVFFCVEDFVKFIFREIWNSVKFEIPWNFILREIWFSVTFHFPWNLISMKFNFPWNLISMKFNFPWNFIFREISNSVKFQFPWNFNFCEI